MTENEISQHIVECAIEVHRTLGGPGLLESVYVEPLCWEIEQRGLLVERQVQVPILRLLDLRLALVINFGEKLVKDGIHRVVNKL